MVGAFNCYQRLDDVWKQASRYVGPQGSRLKLIAAVNRGDLMTKQEPDSCGEYRLLFQTSKASDDGPRLSISIEAKMLQPARDDQSCFAIQRFWQRLRNQKSNPAEIAKRLRTFFLEGIRLNAAGEIVKTGESAAFPFKPALSISNLGGRTPSVRQSEIFGATGQIRINIRPSAWQLHEFRFMSEEEPWLVPFPLAQTIAPDVLNTKSQVSEKTDDQTKETDYLRKALVAYLRDPNKLSGITQNPINELRIATDVAPRRKLPTFGAFREKANWSCYHNIAKLYAADNCQTKKLHPQVQAALEDAAAALKDTEHQKSTIDIAARLTLASCSGCHHSMRDEPQRYGGDLAGFPADGQQKFLHVARPEDDAAPAELSQYIKTVALPRRARLMKSFLCGASSLPNFNPKACQ